MLGQQRQRAHHAVAGGDGVKKPGPGSGLGQRGDVGAVAVPAGGQHAAALQGFGLHHGRGQHAAGAAVAVAGEVVAQHHGAALQGAGKLGVVVQLGLQALHAFGKAGLVGQGAAGELLQLAQARAFVGLGKHGVETEQRNALVFKQGVHQAGHVVARPRPAAHFGQALFVDIDNDHPVVQRGGHGGAQPGVVNDVVQPLQHAHGHHAHRVQDGKNERQQGDGDARAVLGQGLHGYRKVGACDRPFTQARWPAWASVTAG